MNKEEIYDERIAPQLEKIVELCKDNGIAVIAHFIIPTDDEPDLAATIAQPGHAGYLSFMQLRAINLVKPGDLRTWVDHAEKNFRRGGIQFQHENWSVYANKIDGIADHINDVCRDSDIDYFLHFEMFDSDGDSHDRMYCANDNSGNDEFDDALEILNDSKTFSDRFY